MSSIFAAVSFRACARFAGSRNDTSTFDTQTTLLAFANFEWWTRIQTSRLLMSRLLLNTIWTKKCNNKKMQNTSFFWVSDLLSASRISWFLFCLSVCTFWRLAKDWAAAYFAWPRRDCKTRRSWKQNSWSFLSCKIQNMRGRTRWANLQRTNRDGGCLFNSLSSIQVSRKPQFQWDTWQPSRSTESMNDIVMMWVKIF